LRQTPIRGGAKSGAVSVEALHITPDSLAATLLALPPSDRARLAAMLLGQAEGEGRK
jgi:hypothetical protein